MKVLSIQQPWASLICSGLKDVENRTWGLKNLPGKILIHAGSKKVPKYYDQQVDEYTSFIKNAKLMGWLPEYEDMPYGAIVGYADLVGIVDNSESFWAQDGCMHWCLKNMRLFDAPIEGVKGALGLFDYPLDEDNLPPSHELVATSPELKGDTLYMPAGKKLMNDIKGGINEVLFDLTNDNAEFFCDVDDPELPPLNIKTVVFSDGKESISVDIKGIDVGNYSDADQQPIIYTSSKGEELAFMYVAVVLK